MKHNSNGWSDEGTVPNRNHYMAERGMPRGERFTHPENKLFKFIEGIFWFVAIGGIATYYLYCMIEGKRPF